MILLMKVMKNDSVAHAASNNYVKNKLKLYTSSDPHPSIRKRRMYLKLSLAHSGGGGWLVVVVVLVVAVVAIVAICCLICYPIYRIHTTNPT